MSSRRELSLIPPHLVAWFVALIIATSCNAKARADNVLATLYTFAGSGSVDLVNPGTGAATVYISGLSSPSGIAIGTDGTIYVAQQGASLLAWATTPQAGCTLTQLHRRQPTA